MLTKRNEEVGGRSGDRWPATPSPFPLLLSERKQAVDGGWGGGRKLCLAARHGGCSTSSPWGNSSNTW